MTVWLINLLGTENRMKNMNATINAEELNAQEAQALIQKQRDFFESGQTQSADFRIEMLKKYKEVVQKYDQAISDALYADFQKSAFEAYASETGLVLDEIGYTLDNLRKWIEPEKVSTPLAILPGASYIYPKPYGVTFIIGAWNYPFQLTMMPLVGAIAAGNTAIVKPSELSPCTSAVMKQIIEEAFPEEYIAVVEGGADSTQAVLAHPLDYIFFTGSTRVGKIIAKAAAEYLTPTTLELGGKSPCVVHEDAQAHYAAKRIVWGKFLNGGQTCVAPDFLVVHENIKDDLIFEMRQHLRGFYGHNPQESPDYPRIITEKHLQRLVRFLNNGKVIAGGKYDLSDRYLAPTLLDEISWDSPIMQEEIFGPILPIITYKDFDALLRRLRSQPSPLSAYLFTEKSKYQEQFIDHLEFGGGCINDTVTHLVNPNLPFGGVGNSGSGAYHGKFSFDTFSHKKSIHKKTTWVDVPLRYPPYEGKLGLVKQVIK